MNEGHVTRKLFVGSMRVVDERVGCSRWWSLWQCWWSLWKSRRISARNVDVESEPWLHHRGGKHRSRELKRLRGRASAQTNFSRPPNTPKRRVLVYCVLIFHNFNLQRGLLYSRGLESLAKWYSGRQVLSSSSLILEHRRHMHGRNILIHQLKA